MSTLMNTAKRLINRLGYDLRRIDTPMRSLRLGIKNLATRVSPESIIDIGVAKGTPELYDAFPASQFKYLLVEANPTFREDVEQLARTLHAEHRMVFCAAHEGTSEFIVYKNQGLSSAYPAARAVAEADRITVPTVQLDTLMADTDLKPPYAIKIDVEGAELDVLRGASRTLEETQAVVVETSIGKRRIGAAEFGDVVCFMREHGFSVFDLTSGSNWEGNLSLVDVIFVRTDSAVREYGS